MKPCADCGIQKPPEEFSPSKTSADGRHAYCHACMAIYMKRWRKDHPEKAYAWQSRNKDRIRANERKRYDPKKAQIKSKRYRTEDAKTFRRAVRRWYINNPEKVRAIDARSRARRRTTLATVQNDFAASEWAMLKDLYNHTCAYCGRHMERLTKDHIVALKNGGHHTLTNILPACQSCNSKKSGHLFIIPHLLRCADGIEHPVEAFLP